MHVAVLGTGHMATTLATGIIAAGHTVTFGSRNPDQHTDLEAPVVSVTGALSGADLVLNALNASATLDALTPVADAFDGLVVLDLGNAADEHFQLLYPADSLGERLQKALPGARVVKSLNTLPGEVAANPSLLPEPTNVFLSGDDADAKALVSSLLVDLGWPVEQQIDLGGIQSAHATEAFFAFFMGLMPIVGFGPINIRIVR
jgi:8-hydroxy-5-deazaflavin:NADPH oxidoreductase